VHQSFRLSFVLLTRANCRNKAITGASREGLSILARCIMCAACSSRPYRALAWESRRSLTAILSQESGVYLLSDSIVWSFNWPGIERKLAEPNLINEKEHEMNLLRSKLTKALGCFLLLVALALAALSGVGTPTLPSHPTGGIPVAYASDCDGGPPPPDMNCLPPAATPTPKP
jgi:hypothetical protein